MTWNLCAHGQNSYYCSQCNPMNLEALDSIDPKLFTPAPPMKTWKEQFPSGTKSVAQQRAADLLEDIPFGMRKEGE